MSIQQTTENPVPSLMNPLVVGISGTNGSGKDTLGDVLQDNFGFLFISVTDLLRAEAKKRNQAVEREVLRTISAEWRRDHGLGVLVDKALETYLEQEAKYRGLAIASLRNPGEVVRVHELSGKMIWSDAEPKIRYDRIQSISREGRENEDNKTFEQFLEEEQQEMEQSGDSATLNMGAVKEKADFVIENNGDSIDGFKKEAIEFIQQNLGLSPIE